MKPFTYTTNLFTPKCVHTFFLDRVLNIFYIELRTIVAFSFTDEMGFEIWYVSTYFIFPLLYIIAFSLAILVYYFTGDDAECTTKQYVTENVDSFTKILRQALVSRRLQLLIFIFWQNNNTLYKRFEFLGIGMQ